MTKLMTTSQSSQYAAWDFASVISMFVSLEVSHYFLMLTQW